MKGFFTFFIVVLALLSLFLISTLPPPSSSPMVASIAAKHDIADIGRGIETSAVEGAALGASIYISTVIASLTPPFTMEALYRAIDLEEMRRYAKIGALLALKRMATNTTHVALFCYEEEEAKEELEKAMVEEHMIIIPREARHFSLTNCPNVVDVDISLPNPSNLSLSAFRNKSLISVRIGTQKPYGKLGFSYYNPTLNIASLGYLNQREVSMNILPSPPEDFLKEFEKYINSTEG